MKLTPSPAALLSRRTFLAGAGAVAGSLVLAPRLLAKDGGVSIGVCTGTDDLDDILRYGFDYIEPAGAAVAEMTGTQFQAFKSKLLASRVRCDSMNSFIRRKEMKVVGPAVPKEEMVNYVDHCLARAHQLGTTVMVWGSAGSRNVPAGWPREHAWAQIRDFLRWVGPIAERHKVVVAIEPLRRQESNIFNTGAEALRMVKQVNHPNIQMIIDYYHLHTERESPEIIWTAREHIVHFHFANPAGRVWPHSPSEDPGYKPFFVQVKRINYKGGLSIEGHGTFAADAKASLAFFKEELG